MNLELVGFLIILSSMCGCGFGMVFIDAGWPFIAGSLFFCVGLITFIAGRFQDRNRGKDDI